MKKKDIINYEKLLTHFLVDNFEKELLKSSFENLIDNKNKLKFTCFSVGIRELSRNILTRLAPDEKVLKCTWYKNEIKDKPDSVTRGQRVVYAVQGGLSDSFVTEELELDLVELNTGIKKAIDTLNKYVHVNEKTFGLSESEIDKYVKIIIEAFLKLFLTIKECRETLILKLESSVDSTLIDHVLIEVINEIDNLSTHHWIEHINSNQINISEIDNKNIILITNGTIDVKLQYGSSGDLRKGDGLEMYQSFPFKCLLKCNINDIHLFEPEIETLKVDTESWDE